MPRNPWMIGFIAGLAGGFYAALLVRASLSNEPLELEIGVRAKETLS